jgi:hypothetical protein
MRAQVGLIAGYLDQILLVSMFRAHPGFANTIGVVADGPSASRYFPKLLARTCVVMA